MRWLGWVAWSEDRAVQAARLYGAAEALCPVAIAPDNAQRATNERARAELGERLGEDRYRTAYEAGRCLSLDEAVAEASRRRA